MFGWYWLADACAAAGIHFVLAHALSLKAIHGGKSLAELLVSEGLAQTKGVTPNLPDGEKASAYLQKLDGLEQAAHQKRVGAWATTQQKDEK